MKDASYLYHNASPVKRLLNWCDEMHPWMRLRGVEADHAAIEKLHGLGQNVRPGDSHKTCSFFVLTMPFFVSNLFWPMPWSLGGESWSNFRKSLIPPASLSWWAWNWGSFKKVLDLSDLYQMGVSENGVLTNFMVYYWFIISFPVNMAIWGHNQFSDRPRFQVSLRPFGSFWYLAMSSFSTRPTHVPNLYHFSQQDYRRPLDLSRWWFQRIPTTVDFPCAVTGIMIP